MALDITKKKYLSWVLDIEIHLDNKDIRDDSKQEKKATTLYKSNAMIFLRHYLYLELEIKYLTLKDPLDLWINLKDRCHHLN